MKSNIKNTEWDGIDHNDYPDYCDAFCVYAEFEDGTPLSEEALDELNDSDLKYELLINFLH